MSTFAVSKAVLEWALDRSGQTVDDVLPAFPRLREWIVGERKPTLRQLEGLARATRTPLGFLFLAEPPREQMPIPLFRTGGVSHPENPSAELLDTIYAMQLRQAWMREEEVEQGQGPLRFVRSAHVGEPAVVIAQRMRELLGFEPSWAARERTWTDALKRLREAIQQVRVLLVFNGIVGNNTHRKLDPGEFRGFVLVDDYAPLAFVNNADAKAAQMFTLAHELAHAFFGSSAAFDLRRMLPAQDKTELACNQVAAEFLVPEGLLRQVWPTVKEEDSPFQAIARRFKVSEIVAARRALDLKVIGRESFFAFYRRYMQTDRRKSDRTASGGDFYMNQILRVGTRFGAAVLRAAREGRLAYGEAYRMTGLYGKTFEQFADTLPEAGG